MRLIPDDFVQPEPFFIEFSGISLHGDFLQKPGSVDTPPSVLFLHGSGNTDDRTRFNLLRQVLFNYHGISSCAFDFVGHGGTSGGWGETSFVQNIGQVQDIIDSCFDCQSFSVVAVGTSAYTALQLIALAPIKNLTLIAPVMQGPDTRVMNSAHAGGEALIHSPLSLEADLCQAIKDFQGEICVILAEHEQEQSSQLITELQRNSAISYQCTVLEIPHHSRSHELMEFINSEAAILMNITRTVADLCSVSDDAYIPVAFKG